jgi:hypothetical protein
MKILIIDDDKNFIIALFEKVVEGRPEMAYALQAKRASVKSQFPKV